MLSAILVTTGQFTLGVSNTTLGILQQTVICAVALGHSLAWARRQSSWLAPARNLSLQTFDFGCYRASPARQGVGGADVGSKPRREPAHKPVRPVRGGAVAQRRRSMCWLLLVDVGLFSPSAAWLQSPPSWAGSPLWYRKICLKRDVCPAGKHEMRMHCSYRHLQVLLSTGT